MKVFIAQFETDFKPVLVYGRERHTTDPQFTAGSFDKSSDNYHSQFFASGGRKSFLSVVVEFGLSDSLTCQFFLRRQILR